MPQQVPDGARIRIQLLGDPQQWLPGGPGPCPPSAPPGLRLDLFARSRVEPLGSDALRPDDGPGERGPRLAVFDYRVTGAGVAVICLHPRPDADPVKLGLPDGTPRFVLTLIVGVP